MDNGSKINWAQKLSSRTLWVTVAAVLGSIAGSIAALSATNEVVQGVGVGCGIISTAILAGVYVNGEKKLDIARVEANSVQTINQTVSNTSVSASSSNNAVVKEILAPTSAPAAEGAPKDGQE